MAPVQPQKPPAKGPFTAGPSAKSKKKKARGAAIPKSSSLLPPQTSRLSRALRARRQKHALSSQSSLSSPQSSPSPSASGTSSAGTGSAITADTILTTGGTTVWSCHSLTVNHMSGAGASAASESPADSTKVPSPQMSTANYTPETYETSCEVYRRHMALRKKGRHPLWIPQPNLQLPLEYRRRGTQIGDVGIITEDGAFDFMFNICAPATNPLNLPVGFQPIFPPILPNSIVVLAEHSARDTLTSQGISKQALSSGEFVFTCTEPDGAVLVLPGGAITERLLNYTRFQQYYAQNAESWYNFALETRGPEVRNGDLHLVYGCDKTAEWGMIAVAQPHHSPRDAELRFRNMGEDWRDLAGTPYTWDYTSGAEGRVGPRDSETQELGGSRGQPFRNQTLFIQTINTTLREEEWQRITGCVAMDVCIDADELGSSTAAFSPSGTFSGSWPNAKYSSQTQYHTTHNARMVPSAQRYLPSAPRMEPSKVLNEYLLSRYPEAKVAATASGIWSHVEDDCLENRDALVAAVLAVYSPVLDVDGVASFASDNYFDETSEFPVPLGHLALVPYVHTSPESPRILSPIRRPSTPSYSTPVSPIDSRASSHFFTPPESPSTWLFSPDFLPESSSIGRTASPAPTAAAEAVALKSGFDIGQPAVPFLATPRPRRAQPLYDLESASATYPLHPAFLNASGMQSSSPPPSRRSSPVLPRLRKMSQLSKRPVTARSRDSSDSYSGKSSTHAEAPAASKGGTSSISHRVSHNGACVKKADSSQTYISKLPKELLWRIFSLLAFTDPNPEVGVRALLACQSVSRGWRVLAGDRMVWKVHFLARWLSPVSGGLAEVHYKTAYIQRHQLTYRWKGKGVAVADDSKKETSASDLNQHLFEQEDPPSESAVVPRQRRYKPRAQVKKAHLESIYCLDIDSTRIFTGSRDGTVQVRSRRTEELLDTIEHGCIVRCLEFDGGLDISSTGESKHDWINDNPSTVVPVLVTGGKSSIYIWELSGGGSGRRDTSRSSASGGPRRHEIKWDGQVGYISDVKVDKKWIVGCAGSTIRIWDRRTNRLCAELLGHSHGVNALALYDGKLVSVGGDGKVILWNLESSEILWSIAGHRRSISCVDYHGERIVTGSLGSSLKVWDARTGKWLRDLRGHTARVTTLSYNHEDGVVVSASFDNTIKVWDINTGQLYHDYRDERFRTVLSLKATPSTIVGVTDDQKIVILDFTSGLDSRTSHNYQPATSELQHFTVAE